MLTPARKAFVEAAALGLAGSECHLDTCGTHPLRAVAGNGGIRIDGGGDYAAQASSDECFCAGAGSTGVVAGFQSDVGCAAAETLPGVLRGYFEGDDFGVVEQIVLMPAFAGHLPCAVENHAAHGGVGRAYSDAAASELKRALHPVAVLIE